jgi:hypothetical protein
MSQYYDTCIFEHAVNPRSTYNRECRNITDTTLIDWEVSTCPAIMLAEAPIAELLEQFEANCARNGVVYLKADLATARTTAQQHVPLKRSLRQIGFGGQDWWHLCAALSVGATAIVSGDEDFFDPANKRNPNARKKGSRVKMAIENRLGIRIIRPAACPHKLDTV